MPPFIFSSSSPRGHDAAAKSQPSATRDQFAGSTCPLTSPKPTRYPSPSHQPVMPSVSPSSSHLRVSPFGNFSGFAPRQVNSNMQPRDSSVGPLIVPLANKSPDSRLQPLTV